MAADDYVAGLRCQTSWRESRAFRFGRVQAVETRIDGTYFRALVKQNERSDIIGLTFGQHWITLEIPVLPRFVWTGDPGFDTFENAV